MWCIFHYSDNGNGLQQTVQRQHERPNYLTADPSFNLEAVQRKQLDGRVEIRYSTESERSASFAIESK